MMRGKFFAALVISWTVLLSCISFGATYGGGSGTAAAPYQIWTPEQMNTIGAHKSDWGKYFKLMDNIDLSKYSGEQFNLIGRYNFADQITPFSGVFDGNGFTISNFTYNYTQNPQEYIGLFGYLRFGTVKNLRLQNVNINTQGRGVNSGALVGRLYTDSTISDCHVSQGSVTVQASGAAGLVGYLSTGTVTDCTVTNVDVVSNTSGAGGITCSNYGGHLSNCSFEGTVYGQEDVGGLVGSNQGVISRCYANASVNGFQHVGGLVGSNSGNGSITQCCSKGTVQTHTDPRFGLAGNEAGGLVGRLTGGVISDSYSTVNVTSTSKVAGFVAVCWGDTTNPGYITNCYAVGAVSGYSYPGGLIGWNINGLTVITGCFWDTQTSGITTSAGGTGKTTDQMKTLSIFTSAGWDFINGTSDALEHIWFMREGQEYPRLLWEIENGQSGLFPAGFVTVNKTRLGRTSFEYEMAVMVRNSNAFAMNNVQMKLMDWDAAVQSVSDDSITIDTIPAGTTVTSTDTFKIIVDRSTLIDSSRLTWELTYYTTASGDQVQQAMMSMLLSDIDAGALGGDITGDGKVNLEDLAVMSAQWNTVPGNPSADIATPQDNYVGIEDLMYLADNWLK